MERLAEVDDVTLADFPHEFLGAFALMFGLVWGSFLNVVIHRVPRGMSIMRPASHCPACNASIPGYRNLPVVSYLWMRGKAPCCGARVSPRYVLVELIGGVLSLAVLELLVMPLGPGTPLLHAAAVYVADLALALGLTAAAFIDLEFMIVPDAISIGAAVLGVATFAFRDMTILDALIGAALGFAIVWLPFDVLYRRLRGSPGMGLGDAKLLMAAGAWFGWTGVLIVLGASAIQGTAVTLLLLLGGKSLEEPEAVKREREELAAEIEKLPADERAEIEKELAKDPLAAAPEGGVGKARIAFGPFLILSTLECLLLGTDRIAGWFLPG